MKTATEDTLTATILAKRPRQKDSWRTKALIGAAIIGMVVVSFAGWFI